MALIMAAGELFAEHGIDAVTTRAIALKAAANIGIIHYHFKSKEGLIEAVLDFATELWKNNPLGNFLENHRELLKTAEGQSKLLTGIIDLFFKIIFSRQKPSWCCTLSFQIFQRDLPVADRVFAKAGKPNVDSLMEIYQTISGNHDFETSYCWALATIATPIIMAIDTQSSQRIHPDGQMSSDFLTKLQAVCTHNALAGLGLQPVK